MPKITYSKDRTPVACPSCGHKQDDRGKRQTCELCGTEPMPSTAYGPSSVFYPRSEVKFPTVLRIVKGIRQRRQHP